MLGIEADGSDIGAGGIGAVSPLDVAAGAADEPEAGAAEPLQPQDDSQPQPQLLQQCSWQQRSWQQRWQLNRSLNQQ